MLLWMCSRWELLGITMKFLWMAHLRTIWFGLLPYLVVKDSTKGFFISLSSKVAKGAYAMMAIPLSWQSCMTSSSIPRGWTSIWFTTGLLSANERKGFRCLGVKLETPIDLTKPSLFISTSAFHVASLFASPGSLIMLVGQWIKTRSKYYYPSPKRARTLFWMHSLAES